MVGQCVTVRGLSVFQPNVILGCVYYGAEGEEGQLLLMELKTESVTRAK